MPKLTFNIFPKEAHHGDESVWSNLIGGPSSFSLESRIFHSISICLMGISCFYIPYNLYAGLYVASFSAFIFGIFFFHQYYNSRFNARKHNNTVFGLIGLLIFGVNYFANSGIHGSTDLIWPAYLLLVFAITPYRQHLKWLTGYLVFFIIVHGLEFYYPELVKYPFLEGEGQFVDRISTFPIPLVVVYITIKFIRQSYDREKKAAEERAIAVEISKQQILIQKQQLEDSNSEKNKLMSIMSHDLRTPLINIQSYLELLNASEVDDEERPVLERALLTSTNNAVEMLSSLLHWSKSQLEGPSVHLAEINLLRSLQVTLDMETAHAAKKEIIVSYQIPADIIVKADLDMLQLVVRNLIANAVKFTPKGGLIHVIGEVLAQECKITVTDNGSGIPVDKQDKIFSIKAEPAIG
ncbi:MAG: HAMP domain-containing histidine kinase, partial [Pedobacter sp.]